MLKRTRIIVLLAIVALGATAAVAAGKANTSERLFTLQPDPTGNPEGVAFDKRTRAFFVSITADGAIYRGTLGSDTVSPFIPGEAGRNAVGIKVRRGRLYVAGGPSGSITVYDLATKQVVAQFETGADGFLNDLVVTDRGDVFVTDSVRPVLWHVTAKQVRAGSGTPQALDVSEIPYETGPGQFNVNGIVRASARKLVVVDTNSGKLFRIRLGKHRSSIRSIDEIEGATVPGGDGLLRDRGRLVVVQGDPAHLSFLKLRHGTATLKRTQTSDLLRGPSTVARARGLYLVVNADFATSQKPFTVAGLPR
jgi:sugar lactone lactonase YvrE